MQYCKTATYLLLFMLLTLGSCRGGAADDTPEMPEEPAGKVFYMKLSLLANADTSTRSNPAGGEEGDGREAAFERENRIYDLNLFFYRGVPLGDGMNEPDADKIRVEYHKYVPSTTDEGFPLPDNDDNNSNRRYTKLFDELIALDGYEPLDGDWVIVIANVGEDIKNIEYLSQLRDGVFANDCWFGSTPAQTTCFTMATARTIGGDGKILFTDENDYKSDGSKEHPFSTSTVVERTAARIDFLYYTDSKVDAAPWTYDVKVGEENKVSTGSKVKITHILPVNLNQERSYYFKRVTKGFEASKFLVCRDETPEQGKPTNYVLEPNSENEDSKRFENAASEITEASFSSNYAEECIRANDNENKVTPTDGFNTYSILCYANENTHLGTENFTPKYLTGLAFKALYVPGNVYGPNSVDDGGNLIEAQNITDKYAEGTTFWRVSFSHDGNGNDVDESESVYFSYVIKEGDDEKAIKEAYNAACTAAEKYKEHSSKNGIITKYENGVCYYNLWIKHADYATDAEPLHKMQYGIVRNNIYRIGVSFTGPGDPKPKMNGPINMRPKIFVRKWNLREEEKIIF